MKVASPLDDGGWTSPSTLCDRYALTGLNRLDSGDALHAAYSDGLSTVSLFEQRGSLDPDELGGYDVTTAAGARVYLRYGLPTVAVWESDSTVFTLVTDAPRSAVTDVVRSLPHAQPDHQAVVERLGTGLQRIGSFVDVRH
jgi:sigma-E factor negative regulatory protein RseB